MLAIPIWGLKYFYSSLLKNIFYYPKEAKMFILQYYNEAIQYQFSHIFLIAGYRGIVVEQFYKMHFQKENRFEKQYEGNLFSHNNFVILV